ncbi:hypothetical protein ACLKA6_007623 [Drosophila palustris]
MAHSENIPVNTFRNYLNILNDPAANEEIKLKATQELSEHFELIMQSPSYPSFLENALKIFMRILQEGEPQFIQENTIQHEVVISNSLSVTNGMLNLMEHCPKEAAHLRKELLIAARHIFATDLRQKFIPSIEKLFDEDLLIGKGVTLDSIRPLAYSTLADLAHHVRQSLSLDVLIKAVNLFAKNVHDETLAVGIQTMSSKDNLKPALQGIQLVHFQYLLLMCQKSKISIGGGSHDLLYQEFLPLLPNLLEGLNRLQSGFHKQHMRDLFVELCLTVPVRLSSLLPYLPMLMDPLVSALNGSPTLISQGLRTLELCVDNLQPDFLYDHIQPVRAALMQALWKTLRNQDNAALVAFRVLGKFGGGNRKMMVEPQTLHYDQNENPKISIVTYFQEYEKPIEFPVDYAIESAFKALSSNTTDQFYRRQSWEVIRCFLAAFISLDDEKHTLLKLFTHNDFVESNIMNWPIFHNKIDTTSVRGTHQTALIGMLVASATKDLRDSVCPVMAAVVRHYTMVAIAQQAGPFPQKSYSPNGIDPMVLIDALAACMGHEEKELCKPGIACMGIILDTATNIMGNKDRACKLPLMQYLAEKMTALCYDRPWYAKVGGCQAIQFLCKHMSLRALYQHLFNFLKAFMFVLMDLEGDVSNGALDITKSYMKTMLEICLSPISVNSRNDELEDLQAKATYEVIHELVRHITSPNSIVREESMVLLKHIGSIQKKTVSEVMDPHKDVLADIIPPKKHLLRHQPANAQIGLMDGNTFCTTLEPRLFTIDLTNQYHKLFFHELLTLSEAEDATLAKLDCYKNVSNLIPLRITSSKYIEKLCQLVLQTEKNLMIEASSPYREALHMFLQRFPVETVDLFMIDSIMTDSQWNRFFIFILKHKDGHAFRSVIKNSKYTILLEYLNWTPDVVNKNKYDVQHQAVLIIYTLMELDDQWIPTRPDIVDALRNIFDKGEGNKLIGAPPTPYQEDEKNIVSVFINKVFDPDKQYDDAVRIALLQLACLLVERASQHIHDGDANNKRQGNKLRRLMTFAWPCLLSKNCVDPTARYHGHLLLAHIIARLAIHKKIVLQVFHSLLKGHALEARPIVKQALDVLTPAMPLRMEDGNTMLTHWTKKIIVEEGHAIQQLFHILQLIIRHYKVYFPVRHQLVQHLINYMQRLGFPPSASIEHKKLAVDLAEVIIKWELHRIKEDERDVKIEESEEDLRDIQQVKRSGSESTEYRKKSAESSNPSTAQGKCIMLLKLAMRPEIWPQPFDIKLNWLDKVLTTIETPHHNLNNICTAIDFLTFLTTILSSEQLVAIVRPVQRGLSLCIIHQNTRIVRLMHIFLTRLMAIFPPDAQHKHNDLDVLYSAISKMITDNLTFYEKSPQPNASSLFGTLMILKACTTNNPSYIDRILVQFIRVLNRLTKDHININTTGTVNTAQPADSNSLALELLVLSLELIKNRIVIMSVEIRKLFIGTILVSLIEKSSEVKIIKCIIKMLDDWVKSKETNISIHVPSIREKSALLVKLMQYVEKKFADEVELNVQFLEIINYIYRDEVLKQTELTSKLEGAFLNGLRFQNPHIRAKFFEILDSSMRRRLHDRLLYIICSQAWDTIGSHYWIKQCIELLILTANTMTQIQCSNEAFKVPSITSVIPTNATDSQENTFVSFLSSQSESFENVQSVNDKDDVFDIDLKLEFTSVRKEDCQQILPTRRDTLVELIYKQAEFLEANRNIRTDQMLVATSQLCHMDTQLAESVWLSFFPSIWNIFTDDQRVNISKELIPFLASGTNVNQKDCSPSTLNTFAESLTKCSPSIYIPPNLLTYLGKSHNLWHRAILVLEDLALAQSTRSDANIADANNQPEFDGQHLNNIYDSLSKMYSAMHEEDLWAGLWLKFAHYPETNIAISYEQMGFFEEAQGAYDLAMSKFKQDLNSGLIQIDINSELLLWEKHWMRCAKELNQWDIMLDYAQTNREKNMFLILESSWRVPDWNLMKTALSKTEQCYSKHYGFKLNLYKGYLSILYQEDRQAASVERYVEIASSLCIREWRRLPRIVSHIHLPYLQASQQIMELHEASQIHQGLSPSRNSSLHDMKAIVKTWRNRLPVISDDLSHWSDIFTWRQHHYQIITQHLEQQSDQGSTMLGVHASAQAIISFGKIARKHNLTGVCQETLSRIYTIPSVPIVDCFQKIRQQVKCYLQMPSTSGRNEINEALEVIESTNLKYFTGEMNAEFYALKGLLLSQIGRTDEAGKSFSAAVQLHDGLTKAWAMWGDYMEKIYLKEKQMSYAVNALICYLHACRNQNESKTRKYIAKVLWFLSYDSADTLISTFEKYVSGIPPSYWLPWIPQLLCCLEQFDGDVILNLLSQIGRLYPQAVYFPIRTLYLTLKIEQREKHKSAEQAFAGKFVSSNLENPASICGRNPVTVASVNPIKATPPMWRCSKVMQLQREVHPTILSSLEGIVDQMVWFRESWTEEVLRQLRQGLIKCYAIAFENRNTVVNATITPHTLHFVKKLGSTFGIGIENVPGSVASNITHSAASESLAKRAQVTFQDPVFQKMKEQFTNDFDFTKPGAMKLHNLISKLKTWIKVLEAKVKKLPTSFLIEDKCRFLSNFSQKTAEVELPGELLIPSSSHYYVRIARFMPRVEIVQKNNTAARRLYIRGTNGKIYPYLVVLDSGLGDARREERVLQLKRMLNYYLEKQKETSRRFLNITVPRVVPISPQMRLAEDNPNSVSLLKIFKKCCLNAKMDYDMPIVKYYERLSEVQAQGTQISHTILREIFSEVQWTMVSKTLLRQWALNTFAAATDFWQFRKMLTLQLALAYLCEHALNLTRLNPDMMYLHQDSGLMNISYFKFDINDDKQQFNQHRPVPFRLTPNIGIPGINGYAVIVWIHSGNFTTGSPYDIEPFQLVFKQKVIVVTFAYRLNIFGFFSTDDGEAQGNYGLMDQSAALYWVKKNINYFGGDDNRITLMGHDAGAVSTALHMTSGEWSKGAFHKAIIMSGNPLSYVRMPHEFNNDLDLVAKIFGCDRRPSSMFVQCLKRVDAKILTENLPLVHWGPIVDLGLSNTSYPFIENQPEFLFKSGAYHNVPVIIGITDMEEVITIFKDYISTELTPDDRANFFSDLALTDIQKIMGSNEWCMNFPLISDAISFMYSGQNTTNDEGKSTSTINTNPVNLSS